MSRFSRSRRKLKEKDKLLKRMQRRLWLVFGGVCVLFVFLVGRVMYIQYTSGDKYEKKVLSQMSYDSRVIPYQRGNITDINGSVLATSVDVYNLVLDCKLLNGDEKKIDSTINQVTKVFPDISAEAIRTLLKEKPNGQYNVLKKKIPYSQMNELREIMEGENGSDIAGIWFEQEYMRQYPYGSLAASAIGFAGGDGNGAIGLENGYNSTLSGTNGRAYGYLNSDNNLERTVVNPENGKTLVTTLDVNVQSIVEEEIRAFNEKYALEAANGMDGSLDTAVLVMNPNNGGIIAMADYPTFDLNNPRDLSGIVSPEQLEQMSVEDQMNVLNNLWQNFTISYTYEPGSTIKPFTVATGLETGTLTGEETFVCDGLEHISDYNIKCVNTNGHGIETVEGALMDSCNDAIMQMSYRIGGDNFYNYQRLFGFGQRTNVDMTGEARTDSVVFSKEELSRTINMATNSFGQSFNVTMIQLASAFCSLINGGYMYQPHIVNAITDDAGNVIEKTTPTIQKMTVSKETSDILKGYLKKVVTDGTGKVAGVEGYSIGGKTGTAEKAPRNKRNYLVSFIGFAPAEDPEVLIYVVVNEPNVIDQAHSNYAQEIAHNIMTQMLPYMNIKPEYSEAEVAQDVEEKLPQDSEVIPEDTGE